MSTNWDLRFLNLTEHIAQWSKDPSTKVGAVIIDAQRRIISTGYNGFPQGVNDEIINRNQKLLKTIHAESNAILFARTDLYNTNIFVNLPPCSSCAAKIIQSGVGRVVFFEPPVEFMDRWKESHEAAMEMFFQAHVKVDVYAKTV